MRFSAGQNNPHSFTAGLPAAAMEGGRGRPPIYSYLRMCCHFVLPWRKMQISLADLKYAINYGTLSWFGKKTRAHNWRLPSLRSCSGEHGRKSLECDWLSLSPWSRVVTADMSAAQQKAAAAGGAASAETLPWPRAGAGLALIRATGFAAQPEDRPWCGADRRAQDARGQQATQAALRLRQSDAQAHL